MRYSQLPLTHPKRSFLYKKYRQWRYRSWIDEHPITAVGNPMRMYKLSPEKVGLHMMPTRFIQDYPDFGIIAGNWPKWAEPLEGYINWDMLDQHFNNGVAWEKTERYQKIKRNLNNGGTVGGLNHPPEEHTISLYREYLDYIDGLYHDIKNNGYKTQDQLDSDDDFAGRSNKPLDEVRFLIDQKGNFILCGGQTRFFIAKSLGLKSIPVRTQVRHSKWQKLRDDISKAERVDELNSETSQYLDHPELQDIVPDR